MADNDNQGTPVTVIFTLIISFIGFFAVVTCVTLYYYKRGSRRLGRLEQIQQAADARESINLGGRWSAQPKIWEVWADKHPKSTSQWDELLPLNFAYDHDQLATRTPPLRQDPTLPAPQSRGPGWRSLGGAPDLQLRPGEPNSGSKDTTDCKVSVFIAMPTPYKHFSAEVGGEFAIGTAEAVYRHPFRTRP